MNLPVGLQILGMTGLPLAAFLLWGLPVALLIACLVVTAVGTLLELERG